MPNKALHPCRQPGCHELVREARCAKHGTKIVERDPQVKRMYNSLRWKKRRAAQLAKDPWCAECLLREMYIPASEADHIEPHHGDAAKFFQGELQSLCKPCHSRKTASEVFVGS